MLTPTLPGAKATAGVSESSRYEADHQHHADRAHEGGAAGQCGDGRVDLQDLHTPAQAIPAHEIPRVGDGLAGQGSIGVGEEDRILEAGCVCLVVRGGRRFNVQGGEGRRVRPKQGHSRCGLPSQVIEDLGKFREGLIHI